MIFSTLDVQAQPLRHDSFSSCLWIPSLHFAFNDLCGRGGWELLGINNRICICTGSHLHPCPIHLNWVDLSKALYDSTWFAQHRSALPEVKIHEILIHEPSLFLKRGNKLQSIHTTHFMARLDSHSFASRADRLLAWWIDNSGNDSCRFDWIESNRQHF